MNLTDWVVSLVLASALALAGCGGAGGEFAATGGNGGGIGGTGIISTGTVDGFGSIFVNGVEFETQASDVLLNGASATADDLRLGMMVTVRGTLNEDGKTGSADRVDSHSELLGPVSSIETGDDGDSLILTILGVRIIVERTATVFDGVSFATLALNDFIEVSGIFENSSQIHATRIEKNAIFVAGVSQVKLEGSVSALSDREFMLGTILVDFRTADLSGVPGSTITEGLLVEVFGTFDGSTITANRVEKDEDLSHGFDDDSEVTVLGAVTNYVSQARFAVNGVAVDASTASLEPGNLELANGVIVEVEGTWNGSILLADEVKLRRGQVKLEAPVASVDTAGRSLTLQYTTGTVTVALNSTTLLKDNTGQAKSLSLGDITSGNFVRIEAIEVGHALLASRIQRDRVDSNILQAPVQRYSTGVEITLLGVTFGTAGATFENIRNSEVGADAFFGQLRTGDLVKVHDEQIPDGIADEVELEQDPAPDNEPEDSESEDD